MDTDRRDPAAGQTMNRRRLAQGILLAPILLAPFVVREGYRTVFADRSSQSALQPLFTNASDVLLDGESGRLAVIAHGAFQDIRGELPGKTLGVVIQNNTESAVEYVSVTAQVQLGSGEAMVLETVDKVTGFFPPIIEPGELGFGWLITQDSPDQIEEIEFEVKGNPLGSPEMAGRLGVYPISLRDVEWNGLSIRGVLVNQSNMDWDDQFLRFMFLDQAGIPTTIGGYVMDSGLRSGSSVEFEIIRDLPDETEEFLLLSGYCY